MTSTTMTLGFIGVLLSLPAWFYFLRGAAKLFRFVRSGTPQPGRTNKPLQRFVTMLKEVFFHAEMARKPWVAFAHWLVMVGFLLGFVVWFEAYIQIFDPHAGWPLLGSWSGYHLADELLGLGTVLGILFLIGVRLRHGKDNRIDRFYGSNARAAHFVEAVVLIEGLGMLLVKASKIATYPDLTTHLWSDFFTMNVAKLLPASPVLVSTFAMIKLLSGMIWLFVVGRQLTWGVAWHRFLAFFNIFFQRNPDGAPALGKLEPMRSGDKVLTLDNADPEVDTLGVGHLGDASWKMLLDASTCTECGRCQEQCPAWNTQKPLSPKMFVTDLRDASIGAFDDSHANVDVLKLVGQGAPIEPDVLWSCTNCGACVEQCPVDIEHIDHVTNLRRFQVLAESDFPSELTGLFKNLETKGNPWGRNSKERASWIEEAKRDGIEIPVFGEDIDDFSDTEYLFWVGCAGSFDETGRKTSRAIAELLHIAGVKFAVLSKGETCTGDPARRAGNEFLFQMLTTENVATLNDVFEDVPVGKRKIITSCAHCFNTIRNEYPDFDGHFDVFHHTQLLNRLVRDGRLTPIPRSPENRKPITYHDPCFLGRHNKVFDPPRELLESTGVELREMDRNRNEGFCCGAGGARMFMEEKLGTRISDNRTAEAVATGAKEIAVGCPFCNTMLEGGVKSLGANARVNDVAVLLRDAVLVDGQLPAFAEPAFLVEPVRVTPSPKEELPKPNEPATPIKPATPSADVPPVAANPIATTPAAQPPVGTPPVATPPIAAPPVAQPPVAAAPRATPPFAAPPAATPPIAVPPAAQPPIAAAPTATPPVAAPPTAPPPVAAPPAAAPPTAKPPTAKPPTSTPPLAGPPTAQPPGTSR